MKKTKFVWNFAKDNVKDLNYYNTARKTFLFFLLCFVLIMFILSFVFINQEKIEAGSLLSISYMQEEHIENDFDLTKNEFNNLIKNYDLDKSAVYCKQLYLVGTDGADINLSFENYSINKNIKEEIGFPYSSKLGLKLIDFEKSSGLGYLPIFDNILKTKYDSNVIKYGEMISGKKQILVAEQFLDIFNLEPNDVLGKQVSLSLKNINTKYITDNIIFDDDNIAGNNINYEINAAQQYQVNSMSIFQEYEIVGVICSEYFQEFANLENFQGLLEYNPDLYIWTSIENFRDDYNGKDLPYINKADDNQYVITYENFDIISLSEEITGEGYIFSPVFNYFSLRTGFGIMFTSSFGGKYNYYVQITLDKVKYIKNFISEYKAIIKNHNDYNHQELRGIVNGDVLSERALMNMSVYENFRQTMNILYFVGGLFGIIFVFNFFRIINYNLKKRHKNIIMLSSIGLENKQVIRLLVYEMLISLIKALVYALIIFTVIVIVIVIANLSYQEMFEISKIYIAYLISVASSIILLVVIIFVYYLIVEKKYKRCLI